MRADLIVLRLGADRDVLVGVQADSADSVATLRTLFADWLDDTMVDELAELAPAFEVHLTSAATTRGRRTLPHLRYGKEVLIRADPSTPVLHALTTVLGGIHERRPDDGRAWVNLRVFTNSTNAVLTDTPRPHLVADRVLHSAGLGELVNWGFVIEGDDILVPAPLNATDRAPERLLLAGAAIFREGSPSPAVLLAALASHSTSSRWFDAATRLGAQGLLRTVSDRTSARVAIKDFLTKS